MKNRPTSTLLFTVNVWFTSMVLAVLCCVVINLIDNYIINPSVTHTVNMDVEMIGFEIGLALYIGIPGLLILTVLSFILHRFAATQLMFKLILQLICLVILIYFCFTALQSWRSRITIVISYFPYFFVAIMIPCISYFKIKSFGERDFAEYDDILDA